MSWWDGGSSFYEAICKLPRKFNTYLNSVLLPDVGDSLEVCDNAAELNDNVNCDVIFTYAMMRRQRSKVKHTLIYIIVLGKNIPIFQLHRYVYELSVHDGCVAIIMQKVNKNIEDHFDDIRILGRICDVKWACVKEQLRRERLVSEYNITTSNCRHFCLNFLKNWEKKLSTSGAEFDSARRKLRFLTVAEGMISWPIAPINAAVNSGSGSFPPIGRLCPESVNVIFEHKLN